MNPKEKGSLQKGKQQNSVRSQTSSEGHDRPSRLQRTIAATKGEFVMAWDLAYHFEYHHVDHFLYSMQ